MNNTIEFSIIIPTYNRADSLRKAVNSLLKQSYKNFEVIIVDDGSSDNTENVITQIHDERVRYFKKDNEERSIARNFGIEKARGEYIGFLDADDYALQTHLEKAYDCIIRHSYPKVIHLGYRIENELGEIQHIIENFPINFQQNLILDNLLICNAIFIQRDVLKKYNFINSRYASFAEDWYLWLMLAARYPIHFCNEVTSVVVDHSNRSLNILNPFKVKKSIDLVVNKLKNDGKVQEKYGNAFPVFASMRFLFCSNLALEQRHYLLFLYCLTKAILFNPKSIIIRLTNRILYRKTL